jgi:hypothetical protein
MLNESVAKQTIEQTVRRRLAGARIAHVAVRSDFDNDGDPVFRVTVVFDGEPTAQDAKKMVGLVRHIRGALRGANAESFPLLSFMSKREASKLKLAAA